jgi:hypothetical protein
MLPLSSAEIQVLRSFDDTESTEPDTYSISGRRAGGYGGDMATYDHRKFVHDVWLGILAAMPDRS